MQQQALIAQALSLLQQAQSQAAQVHTVAELWPLYWEAEGQFLRSAATETGRAKHLLSFFGARDAAGLTLIDVDAYRARRRIQRGPRRKTTSSSTRNREIARLKRLLSWAVERKLLEANPIEHAEPEPEPPPRRSVADEHAMAAIIHECSEVLRAYVIVAYDTGMRRSEVLMLTRDRVDLDSGTVDLYAEHTKSSKPRRVVLSARARQALRDLPVVLGSPYVFANPATRKPWCKRYLYRRYREAVERADVHGAPGEHLWFHDLRRSFATLARRRGVSESVTQKMGGWETAEVFKRYNIIDESDIRAAAALMDARRADECRAIAAARGNQHAT